MNTKKNKRLFITILYSALLIIGIGYSLVSSLLIISGTSKASGTFNVEIINIVETNASSTSGGATNKSANYDALTATFSADFAKPRDYVEYIVTIQNKGTIDVVLSSRVSQLDSQTDNNNNPIYIFTALDTDGLDVTQYRNDLPAGETTDVIVKILYNENATSLPSGNATFTLLIDAVQESASDYHPSERLDKKCFISVIPGEINYYDTDNPECGSDVVIPDGLRLPVRQVTSFEYNDEKCMANAGGIKDSRGLGSITNAQACSLIESEIESATVDEILSSDLSIYTDFEFGNEDITRNLITKIGAGAFGVKDINSVSFSNSITEIGYSAFQQDLLTSLTLPTNISKIDDLAFWRNPISGTLTIPKSITELGFATFELGSIENVVFDEDSSITVIPERCFNRNSISSITLPLGIEKLSLYSFGSNRLTSLDLSNYTSLKEIGPSAFQDGLLTTINFGTNSSLEIIGSAAFNTNYLTGALTLPKSLKTIGTSAFIGSALGGKNSITALYFEPGSNLETIGTLAFRFNNIGGTLTLPESVQKVYTSSFANNQIEILNIGSNINTIGQGAFNNNPTLATININMTQSDFETNVSFINNSGAVVSNATWYSGSPIIKYNS